MDPQWLAFVAAASTVTLQEAAGFLRDQVALLVQRRRAENLTITDSILDRPLLDIPVDEAALQRQLPQLRRLADRVNTAPEMLEREGNSAKATVEDLRSVVESVLGRHITFAGEDRPATGTPLPPEQPRGATFHVLGDRNVTIGGNHYGAISFGADA